MIKIMTMEEEMTTTDGVTWIGPMRVIWMRPILRRTTVTMIVTKTRRQRFKRNWPRFVPNEKQKRGKRKQR
jgi:hypothetical protein